MPLFTFVYMVGLGMLHSRNSLISCGMYQSLASLIRWTCQNQTQLILTCFLSLENSQFSPCEGLRNNMVSNVLELWPCSKLQGEMSTFLLPENKSIALSNLPWQTWVLWLSLETVASEFGFFPPQMIQLEWMGPELQLLVPTTQTIYSQDSWEILTL